MRTILGIAIVGGMWACAIFILYFAWLGVNAYLDRKQAEAELKLRKRRGS